MSELPIAGQTFFGRASEMDQLCEVFHTHESGQKVVVIWGFGGLGKTRLALQYVKTNQFRYSAVLWVNAATFERAVESFSQAAKNIKYRDESISQPTGGEKDIQTVHQWLLRSNAKDNWLLVIDSVDDVESFECRKLIPQCRRGNIIIISTLSHIAKNLDCQGIELGSIDVAAGVDMLLSKSRSRHNPNSRNDLAEKIVTSLGGVPLAIEQASALIQTGIPIHEFLALYESRYQQLMAHKPPRSAWYYDKNISVFRIFDMAVSRLGKDHDAGELLSLFSCFGPHMIALDLLIRFWESENIIGDRTPLASLDSRNKVRWLKTTDQNLLTFRLAISRLEDLCLMKTKRDDQGVVTSVSVHSTICRWRLETIDEQEREDCIMLAASVLSQDLPDIGMDAVPHLEYIPLIKNSHNLILHYIEPRSLESPNGRLCQQYAAVSARYAQIYLQSPYTKEAEAMITATTNYESVRQGSSWPQDRRSLHILQCLATILWRSGKLDEATEVLESLYEESSRLFGDMDDTAVWAAARLRDVRDRKIANDQFREQAVIASSGTKLPLRLDRVSRGEDFHATVEDLVDPVSDEEYRLTQMVQESKEQFGPSDPDTLQAMSDLAQFYKGLKLHLKAGRSYEHLWEVSGNDNTRGRQALTDAVDSYTKADRLTQEIQLGALKEGLACAAKYGDEKLVTTLISGNAEVNQQDVNGFTALHHAAWNRDEALTHHLLKANAKTEIRTFPGYTPLHMAFLNQNSMIPMNSQPRVLPVLNILVEGGANVDATTNDGHSVLSYAVDAVAYVQFMLDNGVSSDEGDGQCETALQLASRCGYEDIVKLLLASGIYQHAKDGHFIAALEKASRKGHPAVVQLLVAAKANLDGSLKDWSKVFSTRDPHVIRILFEALIDVDTSGDRSTSSERGLALQAVLLAIMDTGNELLLRQLCERNIDINQSTYPISDNATLLHNAADFGHLEVVKLLLASDANFNKLDDFGQSPLFLAASEGHQQIVAMLLEVTKDINTQNLYGYIALSIAVYYGHYPTAELLLKAGAQIAPQEPGPHSDLVPESERISGYARHPILEFFRDQNDDEESIESSSSITDVLTMMLSEAIDRRQQSVLQSGSDDMNSSRNTFSTYQEYLEVLDKEGLNGVKIWIMARNVQAPEKLAAVARLHAMTLERNSIHLNDLEKAAEAKLKERFCLYRR